MNEQAADASAKCACDETVPAKGGPSQAFRIETGKRIVFMADQKKQGLQYVFTPIKVITQGRSDGMCF